MYRRTLPAVLLLLGLLYLPTVARAEDSPTARGSIPLLGARLDTAGTWVAVISRATILAHVELSTEGHIDLTETAFDILPGERHEVAYTGSGLGWVSARMTPVDASPTSGALELRAWVRYVPPPAKPETPWPFLAIFGVLPALYIVWRSRHARH